MSVGVENGRKLSVCSVERAKVHSGWLGLESDIIATCDGLMLRRNPQRCRR